MRPIRYIRIRIYQTLRSAQLERAHESGPWKARLRWRLDTQPAEKWREQVGLPIAEGLAHGCSRVTADQTGLADWLTAHGHIVLPAGQTTEGLALGIIAALRLRRKPESVIGDLPAVDGRLAADDWLFADVN